MTEKDKAKSASSAVAKSFEALGFLAKFNIVFTSRRGRLGLLDCVWETKILAMQESLHGDLCNAIVKPWIKLDETSENIKVAAVAILHRKAVVQNYGLSSDFRIRQGIRLH